MKVTDDRDVHFLWLNDPDAKKNRLMGVQAEQGDADSELLTALFNVLGSHMGNLQPGGTISVLCRRGKEPDDLDKNPLGSTASFIIDNPETAETAADRHEWVFRVERRSAKLIES